MCQGRLKSTALIAACCFLQILFAGVSSFGTPSISHLHNSKLLSHGSDMCLKDGASAENIDDDNQHGRLSFKSDNRRTLLSFGLATSALTLGGQPASAARPSKLYLVRGRRNGTATDVGREPVKVETNALSSEYCLLKLLPVKNTVFRTLEKNVESINALRSSAKDGDAWKNAQKNAEAALKLLDTKRSQLEPVFNPEENTLMQITKGERGEQLIESFRNEIVTLIQAIFEKNENATFAEQKDALLALSEIGELMVDSYPYEVPTEDKFSFLPRLMGRARVTFTFRRGNEILGNVTMIADGFAAPITAGNFVDLCVRQFYTGLPMKSIKKKLGAAPSMMASFKEGGFQALENEIIESEKVSVVTMPVLGSFQEGFYDPLTAKPRRIPLEILRLDKSTGLPELSYSRVFSDLPASEASVDSSQDNKPVLSYDIPGLVGFNHPDRNVDFGSSEFFALQSDTLPKKKVGLLDGQYAPFGYIVDGYELYQSLRAGDVIESTTVSEWGLLNLVKIRGTSFGDFSNGEE